MNTDFFRHGDLAPTIAAAGLRAVDIGSRGGFDPDLLPIAWAVDGIGFEPEPQAFAQLQATDPAPWRSVRWLPFAIGAANGPATLWIPPDPVGASLLEHDPAVGERFGLSHLTSNCRPLTVDTVTLDHALAGLALPDYLKLDVEGAELSILQAAPQTLAATVAIKAEASFVAARKNQPLVADMDVFLRGQGFELMDIIRPMRWRAQPVAPHPYSWRGQPGYSRGQIGQCDLLYFRRADTLAADRQTLAAGLIAMALGYFDHALPLLTRSGIKADAVAHASRRLGRRVAWQQMRANLRELVPLLRSLLGGVPN
ncbi:putative methyltransferases [Magnetospirillum gryphiswaldense MSR-1 v2]|uniref:Methyltransferases n=1 Tax=Magnetospirillum gryphiswaldense (strain DSM 6361 / JCM 21280 / NBRC 15271 / MSR-1) TaxID=431944 RepID=V6F409_MAGGM|nr:FkbM family methyltransferase [Magnetospirillum gryphiswaldense]CDL00127.1 putative methyltransferases [Magnetospirillum gryphiswaldense MSR-1 v2]